jgi:carnitine-CoA ligase
MSSWQQAETFSARWQRAVEARPNEVFLVFEAPDGQVSEWTYSSFDKLVGRVAHNLTEHGVHLGSAIHLALANSPAFVAVWIAAIRLGAWIVPSDPFGAAPELAEHMLRTSPVVGVCAQARREEYFKAQPSMPVIAVDESDVELAIFGREAFSSWPQVGLTDRAAVMFTSGTTGRPKGVVISQANYSFAGKTMSEAAGLQKQHRQLVVLPMFHANAQYYSFASAIWAGASVALMHTFSASQFLTQAARHRATHGSLFAAPIRMILGRGATPVPGVFFEHCWYAMNVAPDQYETFSVLLGCKPRQLYGMTETIPAILTDGLATPNPSSMGSVTNGCEVDIRNSDGTSTAPGKIGEIVVRGDSGITLFVDYLNDPATTAASFADGWFHTGDRAHRDANGSYFFEGRRQDVLKVAGENVSTVEVEMVLSSHPQILEAVVVGTPDPVRDEVPVAFAIAMDPSNPPSVDEIMKWCEERLAKAKRPRSIIIMDELPRTSVGKIRKFVLQELALQHSQERLNHDQKYGALQ